MPLPISLRFIGNGKPVRPNVNPRLEREPSRKGIRQSGVENTSEFRQIVNTSLQPTKEELGRKAVDILRSTGIDFRI